MVGLDGHLVDEVMHPFELKGGKVEPIYTGQHRDNLLGGFDQDLLVPYCRVAGAKMGFQTPYRKKLQVLFDHLLG